MIANSIIRRGPVTALIVILSLVLLAPVAEAGKKKKKKKKSAAASTTQVEQAAAAPAAPAGPSKAVQKAFDHLRAYDTDAARAALDTVADEDVYAVTAQGLVLEQAKDYDGAVAKLRQTADRYAADPAPVFYLGETFIHAKNMGAADDAFAQTEARAKARLASSPDDAEALYYLGAAQQRQRRFDDAVATLEKARKIDSKNPMIVYQLGATKAFQEKWQEAHDLLSRTIEMDNGIAYAYYYRGLAAGKMGRKDLLVNDLDRFLAMAPEAPEADSAKKIRGAA